MTEEELHKCAIKEWKAAILAIILPSLFAGFLLMPFWGDNVWGEKIQQTIEKVMLPTSGILFLIIISWIVYSILTERS